MMGTLLSLVFIALGVIIFWVGYELSQLSLNKLDQSLIVGFLDLVLSCVIIVAGASLFLFGVYGFLAELIPGIIH